MDTSFTEKEILRDGLETAKHSTEHYNTFSNECTHENVRNAMLHILAEEHDIQDDIFHMTSAKGYYPTPAAEEKKVMETRQKFQSSFQ
ncbi:MAG: spore coat protein [Butyribacter sp.]|nr:spore coat protein [bacterium]MDY3853771.1 spore coat protein [Butyribacter sp.]